MAVHIFGTIDIAIAAFTKMIGYLIAIDDEVSDCIVVLSQKERNVVIMAQSDNFIFVWNLHYT